jgi:hypothetical protein
MGIATEAAVETINHHPPRHLQEKRKQSPIGDMCVSTVPSRGTWSNFIFIAARNPKLERVSSLLEI